MKHCSAFLLFLMLAPTLAADDGPVISVYNEADRIQPLAPGSILLIYSTEFPIGPQAVQEADAYPLVTELAGTSVQVTMGDRSIDAFVLATHSQWVRAVLPSNTPAGEGSVVVTYNGRSSAPHTISVVDRAFALYNGEYAPPDYIAPPFFVPRAVQNVSLTGSVSSNSYVEPARPGQFAVLWGTGLGAAPGDERSGPIPGDLSIPGLQVIVGNQQGKILYAGRSGCCAGMDEVIFEVPAAIEGCNVPVWVRFGSDGWGSHDVLVSIASGEGACSDVDGLSQAEVQAAVSGKLTGAQISANTDYIGSKATSDWLVSFGNAAMSNRISSGTCASNPWGLSSSSFVTTSSKDAGPVLNISGPGQNLEAKRIDDNRYAASVDGALNPGDYTLDGAGGSEVGPFHVNLSVPMLSLTSNIPDRITRGSLAEGLPVSWNGMEATNGFVAMWGQFAIDDETCGGCGFVCYGRSNAGSFTIPAPILQRAASQRGNPNELTLVVFYSRPERVSVRGFDIAEFTASIILPSRTITIESNY